MCPRKLRLAENQWLTGTSVPKLFPDLNERTAGQRPGPLSPRPAAGGGLIGGDAAPQVAIPMLLEFWRQGRFPMDRLITSFDFEAIGSAFEAIHHARVIKPVLRMGGV